MALPAGETAWKLAFELSPIILVGGMAPGFLSGYLPIVAITEVVNFPTGLLGGMQLGLDSFFANFRPLPGTTIVEQEIAHYPFANQAVAANAVIAQPKSIVLEMLCPAKIKLGYFQRLAVMEALTAALDIHWQSGGTFIVLTPSKIYSGCLLKSIRDTSQGTTNQPQVSWQWEFEQPLLTTSDFEGALNSLYDWISRGTEPPGPPVSSGVTTTVSTPPSLSTGQGIPQPGLTGTTITSSPLPPVPTGVPSHPVTPSQTTLGTPMA